MGHRDLAAAPAKMPVKSLLALLLGVASAVLAISLADLELRWLLAALFVLAVFAVLCYVATRRVLISLSVILMGLGIPFNLDVNILYRKYVGVTSIDIGVTLLAAAALGILFSYEYITGRSKVLFRYNKTLFWAPIPYMLSGFLSFYNAGSPELVVLELVRLAMLFAIFFIVMNLRDRRQIVLFIVTLSIGVVAQASIAYYQYKTGHSLGLEVFGERALVGQDIGYFATRATGTIGHPNLLAYYFEMLVPLMFAMVIVEERGRVRLWYLVVLLCGLAGLITTLSRGAWISVPFSLPLVFLVAYRRRLTEAKTFVFLFLALVVALLFLYSVFPTLEKRLNFADQGASARRAPLNRAAFSVVKQFPVTGVGLNNLARVFKTYDTTGGSAMFMEAIQVAHNLYLNVWAETGTLGIIAFLWIFAATFLVSAKHLYRAPPWRRGVLIGASAGLLAHMIHGLLDPGFRIQMNVSMLVYALIGLVGAVVTLPPDHDEAQKQQEHSS
jgi:O-antigen ligase